MKVKGLTVEVEGKPPTDPATKCKILHEVVRQLGEDPADGTMMLMTVAAHLAMTNTKKPGRIAAMEILVKSVPHAIAAAEDFFKNEEPTLQ